MSTFQTGHALFGIFGYANFAEYIVAASLSGLLATATSGCCASRCRCRLFRASTIFKRIENMGFTKQPVLIAIVKPLHQLLLVPPEMMQQDARSRRIYLEHLVDIFYTLDHILHDLLGRKHLVLELVFVSTLFISGRRFRIRRGS